MEKEPFLHKIKNALIGKSRDYNDKNIFHSMSLIALFAWVGLGADGLTSSCYGPQEAFLALGSHVYLSIFVALATVITIFIISASYCQIVELFPSGGGGYLVASKLLSPTAGMVSGCALMIDYVLTITVSIAAGADALFSMTPPNLLGFKLEFAVLILILLIIMNLRGVKESVLPLVPIFIAFILTHFFIIIYTFMTHAVNFPAVATSVKEDASASLAQLGLWGTIFLIMKAYSMGAGTYTGIEAVSNSMNILREPRVQTAKITMRYMAASLAFVSMGLMVAYLLYNTSFVEGKTLNAVFLEKATSTWGQIPSNLFIFITLLSEGLLLFVAAQTGFLGGPRVLANMALDRWFPTRFSAMSDRLVNQNGVLIMGVTAVLLMILTKGSVTFLVILYSINVFITFVLSQMGMVRHWWQVRHEQKSWFRKILVSGTGFLLSAFILLSMIIIKFQDGGWMTLLITGGLVCLALLTKNHYYRTAILLKRLNSLVTVVENEKSLQATTPPKPCNPKAKTAVVFVSGFNGQGLHTLFNVVRFFGNTFENFVFVQVGVIDSGNFKGTADLDQLKTKTSSEAKKYVDYMKGQGYYAEAITLFGVDVLEESEKASADISKRFPKSVFFGGQLVFLNDSLANRFFHNSTVFALQKRFYEQGLLFVILPIKI